jgi:CheY-like chemotaxis protein
MDPSQFDQILANLMVNARDATPGVGTITIETENVILDDSNCFSRAGFTPGEYVQLTVGDTGAGMTKEVLDHIFEPFFTTKDLGRGTGLGLATVYGIITQNGGFIDVCSKPSEGTTFTIYLPRFQADNEQSPEENAPKEKPRGGTETILLVEDNRALLELCETVLADFGYKVISTQSPREAIPLAEEYAGDIHLLITDVVMPEMNGRELAEQFRLIRPTMACLFMSGHTADMVAHRGIIDEGVHFISKPFRTDELARAVRAALEWGRGAENTRNG